MKNIFTAPSRPTVIDGASYTKIDYVEKISEILNIEGHTNFVIGSKVLEILLNEGILPIGGVALGRVCACSLRSRLVLRTVGNAQIHCSANYDHCYILLKHCSSLARRQHSLTTTSLLTKSQL